MEESIRIMKRMMLVFIAGLLAVYAVAAMAEEADVDLTEETISEEVPSEETPPEEVLPDGEQSSEEVSAEEACAHEHTEPVYYFDAPEYFPLDGESHMVLGTAIVEIYCQDCGALVDVRQESNAQETRSHVFRNGVCALCGYEAAVPAEEEDTAPAADTEEELLPDTEEDWTSDTEEDWTSEDTEDEWPYYEAPAEWTPAPVLESVLSLPAGEDPDQYTCTLTGLDLEQAGDTLVLLPDGRNTAIVVKTEDLRREIDGTGTFIAQIGKPGDRFISTSIRLYDAYGTETAPDGQDISLRIYAGNEGAPLTVAFTDAWGNTRLAEARWAEEGYWVVNWCGDGLYSIE